MIIEWDDVHMSSMVPGILHALSKYYFPSPFLMLCRKEVGCRLPAATWVPGGMPRTTHCPFITILFFFLSFRLCSGQEYAHWAFPAFLFPDAWNLRLQQQLGTMNCCPKRWKSQLCDTAEPSDQTLKDNLSRNREINLCHLKAWVIWFSIIWGRTGARYLRKVHVFG